MEQQDALKQELLAREERYWNAIKDEAGRRMGLCCPHRVPGR
jgi:hypothetical protein